MNHKFVPGTNISGDLATADWRFLLASQDVRKILFVGIPEITTLSTLSTVGKELLVISPNIKEMDLLNGRLQEAGLRNIYPMVIDDLDDIHLLVGSIDLVVISGVRAYWEIVGKRNAHEKLKVLLRMDGIIYFELTTVSDHIFAKTILKKYFSPGFASIKTFWTTPLSGEIRTAVPVHDRTISEYFFKNVLFGQSLKKRMLGKLGAFLSIKGKIDLIIRRRSLFIQRSSNNGGGETLPGYLLNTAQESQVDLKGMKFGFSARGKYNSNKVIFYLFRNTKQLPDSIIKMTRASKYNERLENEYRVLSYLHDNKLVDSRSFPGPVFFGYHHDLAILCQKAIHGRPFRAVTEATPDCPYARSAIDWIVNLGTQSAKGRSASTRDVLKQIVKLFNQFTAIYDLSDEHRAYLAKEISSIGHQKESFPLVFQHGDPGTWNIFVTDSGDVVFLDWESGELSGMPLWDLFYFFRTYVSWMSRRSGIHNPLRSFEQYLINESEMSILLRRTVAKYCHGTGLETKFIRPLFYTCWMHRALKESARLSLDSMNDGHYVNLLRLCIDSADSPALMDLFHGEEAEKINPASQMDRDLVKVQSIHALK